MANLFKIVIKIRVNYKLLQFKLDKNIYIWQLVRFKIILLVAMQAELPMQIYGNLFGFAYILTLCPTVILLS